MHIVDNGKTVDGDYYRTKILPGYIETLKSGRAFPYPDRSILMQDSAKAHTAEATMRLLHGQNVKVWTDWPGNSPDLNVVEHIWSILQDSVFKESRPRNREQLITRVKDEWNAMTTTLTKSLVDSFPERINECLQNDGRSTKY